MSFQISSETKLLVHDCIYFLSCEISKEHVNVTDISVLNSKISNLTKKLKETAITKIRKDKKKNSTHDSVKNTLPLQSNKPLKNSVLLEQISKLNQSQQSPSDITNSDVIQLELSFSEQSMLRNNQTESSNNNNWKKTKKRIVPDLLYNGITLNMSSASNVQHVEKVDFNISAEEAVYMYKEAIDMIRKPAISLIPDPRDNVSTVESQRQKDVSCKTDKLLCEAEFQNELPSQGVEPRISKRNPEEDAEMNVVETDCVQKVSPFESYPEPVLQNDSDVESELSDIPETKDLQVQSKNKRVKKAVKVKIFSAKRTTRSMTKTIRTRSMTKTKSVY